MNRGRRRHDDILTPREWEVLNLVEAGLTNEQIAERLGISFGTAKYPRRRDHTRSWASRAVRRRRQRLGGLRLRWCHSGVSAGYAADSSCPRIAVAVIALLLLVSAVVFTDLLRNQPGSAPHGDPSDAAG